VQLNSNFLHANICSELKEEYTRCSYSTSCFILCEFVHDSELAFVFVMNLQRSGVMRRRGGPRISRVDRIGEGNLWDQNFSIFGTRRCRAILFPNVGGAPW
jgi:hypothetical protein